MLLKCIIIGATAIMSILPLLYYRYYYLNEKSKPDNISVVIAEKKAAVIISLMIIAVGGLMIFICLKNNAAVSVVLKQQLILNILSVISSIDYKVKKVPNMLTAAIFVVWILFLCIEIIRDAGFTSLGSRILQALGGFLTGGVILLICMLISRGGVGAGDVKLMAILGLFYGMIGILNVMFFSCLYAVIISLVLLVAKKVRLKDSIPMTPFIFAAVVTYNILSI